MKVISSPPTSRVMPKTISENPTDSLCLDSAAFSRMCSSNDIDFHAYFSKQIGKFCKAQLQTSRTKKFIDPCTHSMHNDCLAQQTFYRFWACKAFVWDWSVSCPSFQVSQIVRTVLWTCLVSLGSFNRLFDWWLWSTFLFSRSIQFWHAIGTNVKNVFLWSLRQVDHFQWFSYDLSTFFVWTSKAFRFRMCLVCWRRVLLLRCDGFRTRILFWFFWFEGGFFLVFGFGSQELCRMFLRLISPFRYFPRSKQKCCESKIIIASMHSKALFVSAQIHDISFWLVNYFFNDSFFSFTVFTKDSWLFRVFVVYESEI